MSKLETSGYKRFWPMRQLEGHYNVDGKPCRVSREGYRDMITGEFHAPKKGWDGEPPPLPPGEKNLTDPGKQYRDNYVKTFGHG